NYSPNSSSEEVALDFYLFFFFQAEDGIRDFHVTGVQTCALPISPHGAGDALADRVGAQARRELDAAQARSRADRRVRESRWCDQIGRASCRERVEITVVG